MPGEVLCCASLNEVKISEDVRPTSIAQLAVPASQALSPSLCGVLFIPSKHHVSSMGLTSPRVLPQHVCLSQLISLCQSVQVHGSSKKLQHTTRSFLVHFSLWSPDKCSSTTQCKADQYMCVVSKESFITCPFTCLL